jgi:hypothetical protein
MSLQSHNEAPKAPAPIGVSTNDGDKGTGSSQSLPAKPEPWTAARIRAIPVHDLCKIISPHTKKELEELEEDVRQNKLIVPLKMFEGSILDGRGRQEVCAKLADVMLETNFRTEPFNGTREEARRYVISTNVKRRHLTQSQRAISAARMVTTKLGGDRQSANLLTEITQEDAAKLLNVSLRLVTDAVKVLPNSDLVKQVEEGKIKVSAAAKSLTQSTPADATAPEAPTSTEGTPTPTPASDQKAEVKRMSSELVEAIAGLDGDDAKAAIDPLIRDLRLAAKSKGVRLADDE